MYRVLLVDDENNVCLGLKHLIDWEQFNFQVAGIAFNGQQALQMHAAAPFDLIITDIKMPVVDGLELIKILSEQKDPCKIIIVSAYGEFEYAQLAMRYGIKFYLLKPVDEIVLCEYLTQIANEILCENRTQNILDEGANVDTIDQILEYIKTNYREPLTLSSLAKRYNFNPAYLGRMIKRKTGVKFNTFLNQYRIVIAKEFLIEGKRSINEIAEIVGYNDINYFCKCFKEFNGMTPKEYQKIT